MHNAQGLFFVLPHDVPETVGQPGWRFCDKFLKRSFPGSNGCHRRDGFFSTECLDHWEHFPAPEVKSFLNNGEMEVKKKSLPKRSDFPRSSGVVADRDRRA
jgi:hypothetical protein